MKRKLLFVTLFSLVLSGCDVSNNNSSTSNSNSLTTSQTSSKTSTSSSSSIKEKVSHNITFIADGTTVDEVTFYEGDTSIDEPEVPKKEGYEGVWQEYTLGTEDIEVEAVYTIVTYTATFKVDGEKVDEVSYTIENYFEKEIPEVPSKTHYIGRWSPEVDFSLLEDREYNAVYDLDFKMKSGNFTYDNQYVASSDNSLAVNKIVTMANGTLSTNMKKSTGAEDSGIIFGVTYSGNELDSYWEGNGVSYYFFFININNCAYLAKSDNGEWKQLGRVEQVLNYNEESEYPLSVSFENGYISCFVGEECLIKYKDSNPLTGTQVGFRAQKAGTTYTDLVVSETVKKDSRDVIEGQTIAYGSADDNNGTFSTTAGNTILVDERLVAENGKRYTTNYKASVNQDAGIIVGLKDEGYRMFWEEANTSMEYYFFFINSAGILILAKVGSTTNDGVWTTVADNNNIKDFDPSKTYELGAEIEDTVIKCYVDGMLVHTYDTGRSLVGNMFGLRAAVAGAEFSPIEVKEVSGAENIEWYQRSGSFVKDDNGALTSYCDGSLAWATNREFTKGSIQVDVTASQASDTGIVFGCSDPVGARWEEKPYYFFFVNGGNIALLAGPVNGWTTFKDGGNVSQYMNPYGEANTFKVEVKDNFNIVCYVNGHEVINVTITDSALQLTGTYWGVRCVGQGLRKFENFVITNA